MGYPNDSLPYEEDCGDSRVPELLGALEQIADALTVGAASARVAKAQFWLRQGFERELAQIVSHLHAEYEKLGFDDLTKLPTMGPFRRALARTLRAARRERDPHPVSLCLVDADFLKMHNTAGGHFGGDALIVALAQAIRANVPEISMVARLRGDQFGFILPREDLDVAKIVAERVRLAVEGNPTLVLPGTCSVGVAVAPFHGITVDSLMKAADEALFTAKEHGRNRVVLAAT